MALVALKIQNTQCWQSSQDDDNGSFVGQETHKSKQDAEVVRLLTFFLRL